MPKATTLYHGALRDMGLVTATVKKKTTKSQYPNQPPYAILVINGVDYRYQTENDGCAAFFSEAQGRTFVIKAEGGGKGYENTATITYCGESAANMAPPPGHAAPPPVGQAPPATAAPPPAQSWSKPPPAQPPQAALPPHAQAPPPQPGAPAPAQAPALPPLDDKAKEEQKRRHLASARVHVARNRSMCIIALTAAESVRDEYDTWMRAKHKDAGFTMHPTTFAALFTSMLYGASASGVSDTVPVDGVKFPEVPVPVAGQ